MRCNSLGFSLIELMIALGLSVFLASLLIKVYHWHTIVQHKITDMVFLDHNGVLAMLILENNLKNAQRIVIQKDKIILPEKTFYLHQTKVSNGLFCLQKNQPNATEIVSGVTQLQIVWLNTHLLKLNISLIAPYGMQESFFKNIER